MPATWQRIGGSEATEVGCIEARSEVIEAGPGIAMGFLEGEFVGQMRVLGCAVVHVGQCVLGLGTSLETEIICEIEKRNRCPSCPRVTLL